MNDVSRTHGICIVKDVPFYRGLGRRSNDYMLSFYAHAPEQLAIECGGRERRLLKDEEAWEVVMVNVSSSWVHGALAERPRGAI